MNVCLLCVGREWHIKEAVSGLHGEPRRPADDRRGVGPGPETNGGNVFEYKKAVALKTFLRFSANTAKRS